MNNLLLFFAFPVATIIFAIALQKILRSPFLVAAVVFAAFLIATFTAFDESFLVFAILYSVIALITALLVRFICCIIRNSNNPCINANAGESDDMCEIQDVNNNQNTCCCNRSYINPYQVRRNMMFRR